MSSIQTLVGPNIFVSEEVQRYETDTRIINEYFKDHSTLQWQYYSKRFSEQGFKPANPLRFETERVWAHAASLAVKTYATQEINIDAVEEALERIHNAKKQNKTKAFKAANNAMLDVN